MSIKGTPRWFAVLPYAVIILGGCVWDFRIEELNHRLETGAGRRNSCVPWLSKHQPIPAEILECNQLPGVGTGLWGKAPVHGFQELLKSVGVLLHKFIRATEMHIC